MDIVVHSDIVDGYGLYSEYGLSPLIWIEDDLVVYTCEQVGSYRTDG